MTKKIKLIIAGSTVLAGLVIIATAVTLSKKANQPTLEQKQEEQDDNSKKTEGQVETNKQQTDSQKDSTKEEQQNDAESESGEKTEENSGQVDSRKDGTESRSGEKTEKDNEQTESMKSQVDSRKDGTEEKQQNGAESGSVEKTEEDNKATKAMESQVDSRNNGNKNQQNNGEVGKKVENSSTVGSWEQKGAELKLQLTPLVLYFFGGDFSLRLKTSKTTFEKIKNDRLKFTLDKGDRKYDELAFEFQQNGRTSYYRNYHDEPNGDVSFEIVSNQSYGNKEEEKGTYKVTKVWLSNDSSQTNLLKGESNTEKVPS